LENENATLNEQNKIHKGCNDMLEKKNYLLETAKSVLKARVETMKEKVKSFEKEMHMLKDENAAEIEAFKKDIDTLEKENYFLEIENANLKEQNENLEMTTNVLQEQMLKKKRATLNEQNQPQEERRNATEMEMYLQDYEKVMVQNGGESRELEERSHAFEEEMDALLNERALLEVSKLEDDLYRAKREAQTANAEVENLQKKLSAASSSESKLICQIRSASSDLEETKKELTSFKKSFAQSVRQYNIMIERHELTTRRLTEERNRAVDKAIDLAKGNQSPILQKEDETVQTNAGGHSSTTLTLKPACLDESDYEFSLERAQEILVAQEAGLDKLEEFRNSFTDYIKERDALKEKLDNTKRLLTAAEKKLEKSKSDLAKANVHAANEAQRANELQNALLKQSENSGNINEVMLEEALEDKRRMKQRLVDYETVSDSFFHLHNLL